MSALGPMSEDAPPLQPETTDGTPADATPPLNRNKPILSAGTGL
jgi:two-component system cell cycle sensor histidine kinase PleC